MFRALSLFCLLFLASCQSEKMQTAMVKYHDDGRAKPVVFLASVQDSSYFNGDWSLSEEFSSLISKQLASQKSIYLASETENAELSPEKNPFHSNIGWIKDQYDGKEFVVFVEMTGYDKKSEKAAVNAPLNQINADGRTSYLQMSARLRIIDLRGKTPKIVLQEILKDNFYMPQNITVMDAKKYPWPTPNYENTPIGVAHYNFASKISSRINEYILLAKSR